MQIINNVNATKKNKIQTFLIAINAVIICKIKNEENSQKESYMWHASNAAR